MGAALGGGVALMAGELITRDAQIQWGDLLLGDGTDYEVTGLAGWHDLPGVDSGNADRSGSHGATSGRGLAQQRVITCEFNLAPEPATGIKAALAALRAATAISETGDEVPLVVRDIDTPLMVFGKIARRQVPMPQGFKRGLEGAALQWECSDPRRYSLAEQSVDLAAPTGGSGGLDWDLEYPLDWGTPATPGLGNATNNGDAPTHPVLTITGPVVRPNVLNFLTNQILEVDLTIGVGEQMVIDTNAATITYLGGSYGPTAASVPLRQWTFAPGVNNPLVFRGASFPAPGASLHIAWRSAWW